MIKKPALIIFILAVGLTQYLVCRQSVLINSVAREEAAEREILKSSPGNLPQPKAEEQGLIQMIEALLSTATKIIKFINSFGMTDLDSTLKQTVIITLKGFVRMLEAQQPKAPSQEATPAPEKPINPPLPEIQEVRAQYQTPMPIIRTAPSTYSSVDLSPYDPGISSNGGDQPFNDYERDSSQGGY